MSVSAEIRERVYTAADELLAASEDGDFPSVEAVRRVSRAGMAAVVECLRDWRRARQKRPVAVAQALPAELAGIVQEAAAQLWASAQRLAGERLEAEQAAFEAERAEMQALSAEQSAAFEAQAAEVERRQSEVSALKAQLDRAQASGREALAKASELAATAREAAAEVHGELVGVRSLYSELLAHLQAADVPSAEKPKLAEEKPAKPAPKKSAKMRKPAVQLSLD